MGRCRPSVRLKDQINSYKLSTPPQPYDDCLAPSARSYVKTQDCVGTDHLINLRVLNKYGLRNSARVKRAQSSRQAFRCSELLPCEPGQWQHDEFEFTAQNCKIHRAATFRTSLKHTAGQPGSWTDLCWAAQIASVPDALRDRGQSHATSTQHRLCS